MIAATARIAGRKAGRTTARIAATVRSGRISTARKAVKPRGDRQNRNRFQRNRGEFRERRPQGEPVEPVAADAGLPAFITGGVPRPAPS